MIMNNQRYESGLNKLNEIDGEAGQKVIDSLGAVDLWCSIINQQCIGSHIIVNARATMLA